MERENFTWIGPITDASSAGAIARSFVCGLSSSGHPTGVLDTGCGEVPCIAELDGPVRWIGTTVVRHAPLSCLAATTAILAPDAQARQVAYVVADVERISAESRTVIDRCDEVWAPSTLQLEILCALGIDRARLHIVAPGVEPLAERTSSIRAQNAARVLVVGGDVPLVSRPGGVDFERATVRPGTEEMSLAIARADLVLVLADACPWGGVALEVLRRGRPLAHVESGIAAEYAGADDCDWFTTACAQDPRRLVEHVQALLTDRDPLVRRAERARARIEREECLSVATAHLITRRSRPRILPEPRLSRALSDLGLPTPIERLSGSRAKVVIVPVAQFDGAWREILRTQVLAHTTDPEATVCLWVDESCGADMDRIAAAAEVEIARSGATNHDVLVVLAPLAHAPRERFVTSCA